MKTVGYAIIFYTLIILFKSKYIREKIAMKHIKMIIVVILGR